MNIQIPATGIVKEQNIHIKKDVSIIYGYNNSGKTTILKIVNKVLCAGQMEKFLLGKQSGLSIYIPTNRLITSNIQTEYIKLNDIEDFINYQEDAEKDYSLHLKKIRDYLLQNEYINSVVCNAIQAIFGMEIADINIRYSDGIENVINIYLNIIWAMLWDADIRTISRERFCNIMSEKKVLVLIDEIEMFLHVNIQSKLLSSLKESFGSCTFLMTTHSPLILTRYRNMDIFNIEEGKLYPVEDEFYYENLNIVYEDLFSVEELPEQAREYINYLGQIILERKNIDRDKLEFIESFLQKDYPNLFRRYKKILLKAQMTGENDGRNKTGKITEGISRDKQDI